MIGRVEARAGRTVRLEGHAYDFGHSVAAVEFSLNGGRTWTRYATPDTTDYQNVSWTFDFVPEQPGLYRMQVRAVNDRGEASPEAACVEIAVGA